MSSPSAFNPSATITFIVKNNSSINRSIKVFNTKINPGGQLDVMDVPGVTEEDIRVSVLKGPLKNLLSGGALQVLASTVNFNTSDPLQSGFLRSIGINPSGASGSSLTNNPLTQTSWYVDPVSGSDANDGTTSGTAIKTVAELSSRWGKGNLLSPTGANTSPGVAITVNILNSVPTTDPLDIDIILDGNVRLVFLGGVVSSTPLTVSAVIPRNRATNTPWQFTATGGVTVINRIFDSTVSAYFWPVKDLGGNSFRLSEPCTKPALGSILADVNQVAITNTDTFVMQTLYNLKLGSITVRQLRNDAAGPPFGNSIMFRDFNLTGDYCPELSSNTSGFVYECKFSKSVMPATGAFTNIQNCGQPTGQLIRPTGGLTRFAAGGYVGGSNAFAPTTSALQFSNDIIWQSTSLSIVGSNVLAMFGGTGIFDSVSGGNGGTNAAGNGLMVAQGGSINLRGTGAYIWGSGQLGGGIGVSAGSHFLYTNSPPDGYLSITGSAPGTNDFVLGQSTSTYGIDTTGAFVGPTTNSWANFYSVIGAGTGFGGHATNPQKDSSILKTE
jgi:hypothetical protein